MIEGLRARFLPRFVESARRRIERASTFEAVAEDGALSEVAREMHGLAGEASMLELSDIGDMARSCEKAARAGDRAGVRCGLEALRAAAEGLKAQL